MGFVLTVYFILEGEQAYRWFLSFFPAQKRDRLDKTLRRAEIRMGKWLMGQGSLMLILGVTSTVVYVFLHVRYAYALGVLTGLLNIIPVLGAAVCWRWRSWWLLSILGAACWESLFSMLSIYRLKTRS